MQFINLHDQYEILKDRIYAGVTKVLESGQYILGAEVTELEKALATYAGVKYCVSTASGTVSLEMALRALEIGPGDEVVTTPYSFFATAEVIAAVGAKPVFVDIRPDTFCINEDLIEKAITPRTKAIMPVSLYGQMPDYQKINEIAKAHSLPVIEDGAQSFGATRNGKKSCSVTTVGSTSFYPAKPLGCYGDGGALFTDDEELYKRFVALRNHGSFKRDEHLFIGMNARLDGIQAAILLPKLELLEEEIVKRNAVADRYTQAFRGKCVTPYIAPGNRHVYAQYSLRFKDRDAVKAKLAGLGVPAVTHYSRCIHEQPVFSYLGYKPEDFPEAIKASREILCLPMSPYLSERDQEQVIKAVLA